VAADDSLKKPQTSPGRCQLRFLIKCARAFFSIKSSIKITPVLPKFIKRTTRSRKSITPRRYAVENFNHRGNVNFFIVRDVKSSLLRSIIKSVPPLAGGGVEKSLKEAVRDLYLCVGSIKS
jgi:hypothetical protein